MNEILFGIHYEENDKNWIKIQKLREAGIKEIQVATPVNFLPWLRHLGGKYLVFVSSRSVKMRGSSAFSVCIFLRKVYQKVYKLRKLRNLLARELSFLSLYTFLRMCVYFSIFKDKMHNYVLFDIIHFPQKSTN